MHEPFQFPQLSLSQPQTTSRKRKRSQDDVDAVPSTAAKNMLPSAVAEQWCSPDLQLKPYDHQQLTQGCMLNDDIIRAFQRLLANAYPKVSSWQSPAVAVWINDSYTTTDSQAAVQIHHDGKLHWLTSARTVGGIFVADSLSSKPSRSTIQQLIDLYHNGESRHIFVTYLPCQRQIGAMQCGDFAVAFASVFASRMQMESFGLTAAFKAFRFDQLQMRTHLLACLKSGTFAHFPTTTLSTRLTISEPATFRIDCDSGSYRKVNSR